MAKHYCRDTMTGRVTVAHRSEHFDAEAFRARQALLFSEQDTISARAERLAIAGGFTRSEYRAARPSTRSRWQTRALDAMIAEGHTFHPLTVSMNRPA